jgi:hypothetical protein
MESKVTVHNACFTNSKALTAVILLPEDELTAFVTSVDNLLKLSESKREIVFKQLKSNAIEQQDTDSPSPPSLMGFLRETFTFSESYKNAIMAKETADCDKSCVNALKNKLHAEMNAEAFNIVLGVFSPATKLKLFGPQSLIEGKLIGEGKDAIVYALQGSSDWVIKVLKFGGAERAELLEHYINQLAADARLKVPEVKSLGDGRLLQPFVEGTPKANSLWGEGVVAAQEIATDLTNRAKQVLGVKEGQLFIDHPTLRIGIDPSFANFHFNEHGAYKGWIDPLFHLEEHAPKR